MARLILKSPYLKYGGSNSVSGYLKYIGTRERVELLPDDRPPTRKQEQFITKLVTRALEENWSAVQQSDGYMKYIATRERWRTFRTTAHPKAGTAHHKDGTRFP